MIIATGVFKINAQTSNVDTQDVVGRFAITK